jgi:hypothetical protein
MARYVKFTISGPRVYRLAFDNLQAAGPPTPNDDVNDNYLPGSMWVDKTGNTVYLCVDATAGAAVWVPSGGKFSLPFSFGDASPAVIGTVPANKIVTAVRIVITTAFNGTGASLAVGSALDPDGLMDELGNDPAQVAEYESSPGTSFGLDTSVRLTISPGGGASAGAGVVFLEFQP